MKLHLEIIGFLLVGLAVLHIFFPKYFNWKKELLPLSLINKQLMYVHTFFIGLMVFQMGILCIAQAEQIINTDLGHILSLGLFIFWFTRLIFQLFVYSPKLWKGKRFETIVHVVFTLLWIYFCIVFFTIYWQ